MTQPKYVLLCILFFCLILAARPAMAAMQGMEINWFTADGGGGLSSGGGYSLQGSIGHPDAGKMAGGGYTLAGGFWSQPASPRVYLPMVIH